MNSTDMLNRQLPRPGLQRAAIYLGPGLCCPSKGYKSLTAPRFQQHRIQDPDLQRP